MDYALLTKMGTFVEMHQTNTGIVCMMNGEIQSALSDEYIYHYDLVSKAMALSPKTVCIFGGGEGATAREVLKHNCVKSVDMIDWDKEVVDLFRDHYPQWAKGAWQDPRLSIRYKNAFTYCRQWKQYDTVIVDLFEPDNLGEWLTFIDSISRWVGKSIAIYVGTTTNPNDKPSNIVEKSLQMLRKNDIWASRHCTYVPSFGEYAIFITGIKELHM